MFANVERDRTVIPALAEVRDRGRAPFDAAVRDILAQGLRRSRRVDAAIGLATSFAAWHRLARDERLPGREVVEVLAGAVEAAARG
jgi:hypothetical protein